MICKCFICLINKFDQNRYNSEIPFNSGVYLKSKENPRNLLLFLCNFTILLTRIGDFSRNSVRQNVSAIINIPGKGMKLK